MKPDLLKLTLLHSNDMHGDFLAEVQEGQGKLIGGLGFSRTILVKLELKRSMLYMRLRVIWFKAR
jgi:5'-nucleotidase / UDP-sugar diphosphatase